MFLRTVFLPRAQALLRPVRRTAAFVAAGALLVAAGLGAYSQIPQAVAGQTGCVQGPPTMTLSADKTTLLAGASTTITVEVTDTICYTPEGSLVTFSVNSATATLSDTSAHIDSEGRAQVTLTDSVDEVVAVSALISLNGGTPEAVPGPDANGAVHITFEPSPSMGCARNQPSSSVVASSPSAMAGSEVTITVTVTDSNCTPLPNAQVQLATDSTVASLSDATGTTDSNGTLQVVLRDTKAEKVAVTATAVSDGSSTPLPGSPLTVTFTPGTPSTGPFECADGQRSTGVYADTDVPNVDRTMTITGLVTDKYCNPVPGAAVEFSTVALGAGPWGAGPSNTAQMDTSNGTTTNDGTVVAMLTDTKPDQVTVSGTMTVGGAQVPMGDVTLGIMTGIPVSGPYMCSDGSPGTGIYATSTDASVEYTMTVRAWVTDQYCNWIPASAVLQVTGAATMEPIVNGPIVEPPPAALMNIVDTKAEMISVYGTATYGGGAVTLGSLHINFAAGPTSVGPFDCQPGTSLTVDTGSVYSGDSAKVTVLVTDRNCNPVSGVAVAFKADGSAIVTPKDGQSGATAAILTDGDGQAVVTVDDTEIELVNVSATVETAANPETIVPGSPAKVSFLGVRPPDAPIITSPATGSITNNARPTISGTATKAGDTIMVYDLGGLTVCTATVQPDRTWTCRPTADLSQGDHTLTATAYTTPTSVSAPSSPVALTVRALVLQIEKAVVQVGE
ncbi:MAG: Ig-like domain-containing protein, partial [Propionibacteriaceae bacterium]|nr:Ig-like domain-containing protein [Propionibacteriaceae bacterium]